MKVLTIELKVWKILNKSVNDNLLLLSTGVGEGVGVNPVFDPGLTSGLPPLPDVGDGVGIPGGVNWGTTTV